MTISDPLHGQLTAVGDHFAILVHASDTVRAARALDHAAIDIARLAAAPGAAEPRLSSLAPLPEGPLLRIDDLSTRVDTRRRFGVTVRAALDAAGLASAEVSVLPVDGLVELDRCRRAVVLRLFPAPTAAPVRIDPAWIDLAADWVFGDQRSDTPVSLRILGVERRVPAAEAAGVLHACASARVWCDVVTGDVEGRIRTASISFGTAPHVAIAGGGPRCDDDGLVARYELLREVAADVADDCAYACIDFEETFAGLGFGLAGADWGLDGGAAPNVVAGRLVDAYIPDVYGFQLLGPGHLERLAAAGTGMGGNAVGDRRLVELGAPVDWLITSEVRPDVRADGWESLAPLLLRADDLDQALARHPSTQPALAAEAPRPLRAHGVPHADDIVLEPHPHPRRGTRLTPLELAAWTGGEPHSDDPESVSPVLARFVRHLGVGLSPDRRQRLIPMMADVVDTALGDADEHDRAWQLTDWLVRRHAPRWLRQAGLSESGDRLGRLDSITEAAALTRAVTLLTTAGVTAHRRLALTVAIADAQADLVDRITWDAWEEAAETSALTAASEAVGFGVPADVAYATDHRVADLTREGSDAAEGTAAVWRAARSELAAVAWRAAWDQCEAFVRHESTFSIRTAIARSLQAELDTDDELAVEAAIDTADRAVREVLADALGQTASTSGHWSIALAGARAAGADGAAWGAAFDATRGVLGPVLFDDTVAVAEAALDDWLRRTPDIVGRAVAAAVAREASSVAARAIAARTAAECLARGGSEADATRAAGAELRTISDALADEAIELIGRLTHRPGAH